jgi:hypothetical protein
MTTEHAGGEAMPARQLACQGQRFPLDASPRMRGASPQFLSDRRSARGG